MTTTTPLPRNGVDVPTLCARVASLRRDPATGRFGFRASNRWVSGAHSRSTVGPFVAAGRTTDRTTTTTLDADHPAALIGTDRGPTPLEYVCVALAASISTAVATVAATRGVDLFEVRSHAGVDLDIAPMLGAAAPTDPRLAVGIDVDIEGDAADAVLRGIVDEARHRSPVTALLSPDVHVELSVRVL